MKKATYANKLAELLGITQDVVEKSVHVQNDPEFKKKSKSKNSNGPVGISEDEIQHFREAQGIVYFLQAPELFSPKVCPHCGESFLVSRQFVAFCSYTCIAKDLETKGLKWEKGKDIEALVTSVYEGNEPIWIKNVDRLRECLDPARFKAGLLSQASMQVPEKSSSPQTASSVPPLTTSSGITSGETSSQQSEVRQTLMSTNSSSN